MVAPYTRFFIPAVSLSAPGVGTLSNLDGNGLTFEWDVFRDNTSKADQGLVRIFNLAPAVSGAIYKVWQNVTRAGPYRMTFSVGWEGRVKKVMAADVWRIKPSVRDSATDSVMEIHMGDGQTSLRDQVVGFNITNASMDVIIKQFVTLPPAAPDIGGGGLGLIYTPESATLVKAAVAATPIGFLSNLPAFNSVRDFLDFFMETIGLEWRVHNGEFIAMRAGVLNRPGRILSPRSGLINYTPRDDGGVTVEALSDPEIEPGLQVFVQNNLGQNLAAPIYRTESTRFFGRTDGEALMTVEAQRSTPV